jgi:hypothetical protein
MRKWNPRTVPQAPDDSDILIIYFDLVIGPISFNYAEKIYNPVLKWTEPVMKFSVTHFALFCKIMKVRYSLFKCCSYLRERLSFSYVILDLLFFLLPHCLATSSDFTTRNIPSASDSHFIILGQYLSSCRRSRINSHRWYTLDAISHKGTFHYSKYFKFKTIFFIKTIPYLYCYGRQIPVNFEIP